MASNFMDSYGFEVGDRGSGKEEKEFRIEFSFCRRQVGGAWMSWRWSMEVNILLSTLPLQLEQAFVGCPLSFVRESIVSPSAGA